MELKSIKECQTMGVVDIKHIREINQGYDKLLAFTKKNCKEDFKRDVVIDESMRKFTPIMDEIIETIFTHLKKSHDKLYKV